MKKKKGREMSPEIKDKRQEDVRESDGSNDQEKEASNLKSKGKLLKSPKKKTSEGKAPESEGLLKDDGNHGITKYGKRAHQNPQEPKNIGRGVSRTRFK